MADQVTMTWTDTGGTYSSTFMIENPTLADVKEAYSKSMAMPGAGEEKSNDEFYAGMSQNLVNQVLQYAQNYKQHLAIQSIPPIVVSPVEPGQPVATGATP